MHLDCADAYTVEEDHGLARSLRLRPLEPEAIPADELALGQVVPQEPVPFRVDGGRVRVDLVGTTTVTPYVVSARFVRCLSDHGFSGWSTFPVRIEGRTARQLAGHRGLAVTGRSGPVDDVLSERVLVDPPVPGGAAMPHLRVMCPQEDSWDGSDLFVPEGTVAVCVTSRVRDAFVEAGLTGAHLVRLSEVLRMVWDE